MSRNKLLTQLGLFVDPGFLDVGSCTQLVHMMMTAPAEPAAVYVDPSRAAVDERLRRALTVELPAESCAMVERALDAIRPDLERHFHVSLTTREPPNYLVYGPGAFFAPHRDRPRDAAVVPEVVDRQISVVLFLSAPRSIAGDGYQGGGLSFYGLLDGPDWKEVGFGCDADPGLLVAFRADTLHEVSPVTAGKRCTIVTWFG